MGIPFVRFERKEVPLPDYDKLHIVVDETEAANLAGKLAKENNNHVYLTTGSKTMHIFAKSEALRDCEVWTRILPTAEVLQMMVVSRFQMMAKIEVAIFLRSSAHI